MSKSLRDLDLDVFYDAPGTELAEKVLLPALWASVRYDRISSYFNLQSLVSIGLGIESLVANYGKMRLLMGLHDVRGELVQAVEQSSAEGLLRGLRARILDGVTRLSDELARDRVRATALMLRDGLLEVRCVGYRGPEGTAGIFHNKRLIFVDRHGDVVTATGSPNETGAGLGGNFEELTLHMSWNGQNYTRAHTERFEEVWTGQDDRLMTLPVDAQFANDLLRALNGTSPSKPGVRSGARLAIDLVGSSPLLGALNSSLAPMYPHQERAFVEVCSRWPIRAILADEVGLGKTYEAASVISFALKHCGVGRVVVLAPPTLLRQWQDELSGAFGLDFWRYDSTRRVFLSLEGETRRSVNGPFGGNYPPLTIVSRDLARGTRRTGHAFEGASALPDMVVVDEAHAVRKARSTSGVRASLVGAMIRDVLERVPHALLLTATPLQVAAAELHDALELLGVPVGFDEQSYSDSLELLAIGPHETAELSRAGEAARYVRQFIDHYSLMLPPEASELKARLDDDANTGELYKIGTSAQTRWPRLYELFLRTHPAATMCVRNTRDTLAGVGYVFPERRFRSVECEVGGDVGSLLSALDAYLGSHLGMVETELYPDRSAAVGFVRSTYSQRAASSLVAVRASLERRLARIETLLQSAEWSEDSVDEDGLDAPSGAAVRPALASLRSPALRQACNIEAADITSLLGMLGRLRPDVRTVDPKLYRAVKVASDFAADGKKVLLFSRYTDTVDGLIETFREQYGAHTSYGVYTGGGALVHTAAAEQRGDKGLVTAALADGAVDIVFCSDAASEGLNLQSASVLINVDVPWNPARLEQRIGRIARLGQKAEIVDIINLWYPHSVEAKIYERVLKRKETMELALGTFPEIVGNAIRSAMEGRGEGWLGADVLETLNGARAKSEMEALAALWSAYSLRAHEGGSANLRLQLADVLRSIGSKHGPTAPFALVHPLATATVDPLLGPKLTLHRNWLEWMSILEPNCDPAVLERLGVLTRGGQPLLFALKDRSWVKVLSPASIPDVYRALYLAEPVNLDQYVYLELRDGEVSSLLRSAKERWWPTPEAMTIPLPESNRRPQVPPWADSSEPLTFRPITS